ncbi:hypothetical protein ATANTOWER_012369 [Ataeniobius toweri]|uniref:Kinesin motor domain-containing protein n=1 Tax=Ataeniobius toweri TaxID=208326 RepID=A0ABU7A6H7_9TELE|nr:hypothetical protein [Ataeniobius toweri]
MGEPSLDDSNVKVAVRVRPMNRREKELNTKCVVEMSKNQTILHPAGANLGKADSRKILQYFPSGRLKIITKEGDFKQKQLTSPSIFFLS